MKNQPKLEARESPTPRSSTWIGASFLFIAFVLFAGALKDEFVLDGMSLVRDNPLLSPFEPVRIAGLDWWEGTGKPGGLYRPVSLVTLAALRAIDGGGPDAINFANVLLIGVVAWLHYALLVRFLGQRRGARTMAWIAAVIALVHPLGVEVVAGQVGLADLLASLWMCAAVLIASGASRVHFAFGVLFAALAALSKETGVLVVPLAVLFEALRAHEDPARARRVVRALAWSGLGVAVALACRFAAIGTLTGVDDPVYAGFSAVARIASACATFAVYSLPLLIAPWRQLAVVSHQDVWPASGFSDPRAIAGVMLILAACIAPVFALRRGRRDIAFAAWFFVAAWLPTSNLLFSSGAIAASRFFQAGLFALALPLAVFLVDAWPSGGVRRACAGSIACWFLLVMPALTWRETAAWHDERSFLEAQVARAPASVYSLVDLGDLVRDADPRRAIGIYETAANARLPSIPGHTVPPEDLLESLYVARLGAAALLEASGERARAEENYRAAAGLTERGRAARAVLPFRTDWNKASLFPLQHLAAGSLDRARTLSGSERASALDEAQRTLDACDACEPEESETIRLRSILLDLRGDSSGRARLVEEAWKKRPDDKLLQVLWANELRQRGRPTDALRIELDVASTSFDTFDPERALAIAKSGLESFEPALAAASRSLLERLARLQPTSMARREIAQQAQQLLRGK